MCKWLTGSLLLCPGECRASLGHAHSCRMNPLEWPSVGESCLNMFHCNSGNLLKTCGSYLSPSEGRVACQGTMMINNKSADPGVFSPFSGGNRLRCLSAQREQLKTDSLTAGSPESGCASTPTSQQDVGVSCFPSKPLCLNILLSGSVCTIFLSK